MAPQYNEHGEIRAAGGIVIRPDEGELHILLVHRPAYGDWSIPKGKVKLGEQDDAVALREVREETGLTCDLGAQLGEMHYRDRRGRTKVCRYWAMSPTGGCFQQNLEVDSCKWFSLLEASTQATRSGERDFLSELARCIRRARHGDRLVIEASQLTIVHEEQ